MPEKTTRRKKIATATTAPLSLALPPVDRQAAAEKILDKLFELALEGNLNAAKIYLDYRLKGGSDLPEGLTLEEAIRLLGEHDSATATTVK